jgi:hypothetical protein
MWAIYCEGIAMVEEYITRVLLWLVLEEFERSKDSNKLGPLQNFPSKDNSNIVLFKINVPPRSYACHAYH